MDWSAAVFLSLLDVCGRLLALVLLRRRPNGKSVCFYVNSWGPIAWERRPNGTLLDVCGRLLALVV